MESQRKYSRSGMLSIAIVVVIICLWWAIVGPKQYRLRKDESKIKTKLQEIQLPTGTKVVNMSTSHRVGWPEATGDYSTDWDCGRVKTYYKAELARSGFTVQNEYKSLESQPTPDSILFSSPEYDLGLTCPETGKAPRLYMIILTRTNVRD